MNRIRELRKRRDMTQKELAKHLQIADSTLSYWEMGRYEPDSNALLKLSRFFNVPIDYILGGDFVRWDIKGEGVLHSDIIPAEINNSDIYVSEANVPYKKDVQSALTSNTTNGLQLANVAFDRVEFTGLTQEEIDILAEYAVFIKSRRKSEK